MSKQIKILLVEDDMDFVYLIKKMIEVDPGLNFAAYARDKATAVSLAIQLQPDIVIMDLSLTGNDLEGIQAAKEIRLATSAKILLLTSFEQPEIMIDASKKAFASGYIFKSQCQTITDAIHKTATAPTPQEQFIKELVLQDLSYAERNILNSLIGLSEASMASAKTVANQKTSIFKKLGLKNTQELIRIFRHW